MNPSSAALGGLYPHLAPPGDAGAAAARLDAALREALQAKCRDSVTVKQAFFDAHADDVIACAHVIADSYRSGGRLYSMGNGGSSCDAAHIAVEFETTMPSTALTVLEAERLGIRNFSLFCNHITIVPTIKAILDSPGMGIAGFIGPGHVALVTGTAPFEFIAQQYRRPLVVSGFEPTDILQSLWMVLRQLESGRAEIENQYARLVDPAGNAVGLDAISRVFELREFFEWRGLGSIDHSGIRVRAEYAAYDAEKLFALPGARIADPKSCQCGEVLKGAIKPPQCKVFGSACTPQTPLGALMVSSEGACAAYCQFAQRAPMIPIGEAV